MPDSEDGRVTVAILKNEMSHLRRDMEQHYRLLCQKVETGDDRIVKVVEDHEERLRSLEGSQPWNVWRDAGAFLTGIAGIVSGWLNSP